MGVKHLWPNPRLGSFSLLPASRLAPKRLRMWEITSVYASFQRVTLDCVRQDWVVFVGFGESFGERCIDGKTHREPKSSGKSSKGFGGFSVTSSFVGWASLPPWTWNALAHEWDTAGSQCGTSPIFFKCVRRKGEPMFSRSSIQWFSGMVKNTSTIFGSNCVPAHRRISSRA
jgi:hypothetical protein